MLHQCLPMLHQEAYIEVRGKTKNTGTLLHLEHPTMPRLRGFPVLDRRHVRKNFWDLILHPRTPCVLLACLDLLAFGELTVRMCDGPLDQRSAWPFRLGSNVSDVCTHIRRMLVFMFPLPHQLPILRAILYHHRAPCAASAIDIYAARPLNLVTLCGPPLCINGVRHRAPTQVFFPSVPHISKLVSPAPTCCISLAQQNTAKVLNAHAGLSYRSSSSFVRSNGTTAGCNFHISTCFHLGLPTKIGRCFSWNPSWLSRFLTAAKPITTHVYAEMQQTHGLWHQQKRIRQLAGVWDANSSQAQRRNLKKVAHGKLRGSTDGRSNELLDFKPQGVHIPFCLMVYILNPKTPRQHLNISSSKKRGCKKLAKDLLIPGAPSRGVQAARQQLPP